MNESVTTLMKDGNDGSKATAFKDDGIKNSGINGTSKVNSDINGAPTLTRSMPLYPPAPSPATSTEMKVACHGCLWGRSISTLPPILIHATSLGSREREFEPQLLLIVSQMVSLG